MHISGAWHALHAIAEMEWVRCSATIVTMTFKFIPNTLSYSITRPSKYNPFSCYDNTVVMSFRSQQWHAMHAMLLRFSSYKPVLILKSQRLKFSQTNNLSQINKFFVFIWSALYFHRPNKPHIYANPLRSSYWVLLHYKIFYYVSYFLSFYLYYKARKNIYYIVKAIVCCHM